MADKNVKIVVEVGADTGDASKKVGETRKQIEGLGDSAKKSEKEAKGAFGSIGNSLKSLGIISAVVKGFDFFKETLMKNQKVADAFSIAINFLTGIFSDFVSFLVDNTDNVVKFFKDVFENPTVYIDKLATAIKDNLIERVKSVIDAFGFLGDVIKNVFTGKFDEASEAAKNFGKELVDVVTGVDDSVDKTTKAVNDLIDVSADYFGKKLDQAKALTKATNDAILAEARMVNTIKQTEIAAEKLRQKRDDETISIQERIKANDQLGEVLKKGQAQELSLVAIRENKIRAEIALNGQNKDLQAELIRLQGERTDIEEKYTAFASEQLVNRNGLLKEERDIQKSISENQNKLLLDSKKANAELIKDELERLQAKRDITKEESKIELFRLQQNIDNTNEGTAARAEAEIAYAQKKAELANSLAAQDDQINVARAKRETDRLDKLISDQELEYSIRKTALDQELALLKEAKDKGLISEQEYNDKYKALSKTREQIDKDENKAKVDAVINTANALSQILGEQTVAGKALGIATATINTYIGATEALREKSTLPQPFSTIQKIASVAAIIATGIKTVKSIAGVKVPGGGGGGGSVPSLPSFSASAPLAPQSQTTRLDQAQINQIGNVAARAYVVESDVTSAQERANRLNRAATIQ